MARMRSIKPEMFRSFTVTAWPVPVRWTFAGLLTYCDDEGRAADDARLIKAELYPIDDDVSARRVEQHLALITAHGPLCRYEVAGRRYLHITSWSEHQRINRPTASRIPPCPIHEHSLNGSSPPHGGLSEDSVRTPGATPEPSRPRAQARVPAEHGTGSKGAREQGSKELGIRDSATRAADPPRTAQTLLAEWIDHCPHRPPSRVIGNVAKLLGELLAEGVPYEEVRAGFAAWHQAGKHPATLPSFVHAAMPRPPAAARSTTDDRVSAALALAEELATEQQRGELRALPGGAA